MTKIFIDLGHGGKDSGAIGNGLQEKDLVLTIGLKIKKLLEHYDNIEVKLSRNDDTFLELTERANMANEWGADIFISIHINAGGGIGFESFIHTNASSQSSAYQNVLHNEIIKAIGGTDRGKKGANFSVLRNTRMSAVLTEIAFIDNTSDAKRLKDPEFINKVVQGHVNGLVQLFGLKKKVNTDSNVIPANVKFEGKSLKGEIKNGVTSVEVRQLAELLGLKIKWDQKTKTVYLER